MQMKKIEFGSDMKIFITFKDQTDEYEMTSMI